MLYVVTKMVKSVVSLVNYVKLFVLLTQLQLNLKSVMMVLAALRNTILICLSASIAVSVKKPAL